MSSHALTPNLVAEPETAPRAVAQRQSRRLSDKILVAFHQACDQQELDVAAQLLAILEAMITRRPANPDLQRRRDMDGLIAAHERLWGLRQKERPAF